MSHCCPIKWNILSFILYTVILEEKSHGTLLEEKGENTAKKFSYGRTIRKMGTYSEWDSTGRHELLYREKSHIQCE
jgi:hypothetical protein